MAESTPTLAPAGLSDAELATVRSHNSALRAVVLAATFAGVGAALGAALAQVLYGRGGPLAGPAGRSRAR